MLARNRTMRVHTRLLRIRHSHGNNFKSHIHSELKPEIEFSKIVIKRVNVIWRQSMLILPSTITKLMSSVKFNETKISYFPLGFTAETKGIYIEHRTSRVTNGGV